MKLRLLKSESHYACLAFAIVLGHVVFTSYLFTKASADIRGIQSRK
jgi:hypothetical protein